MRGGYLPDLLRLFVLGSLVVLALSRARGGVSRRDHVALLALLAVLAFLPHLGIVRAGSLGLHAPFIHYPDFYHYYLGTKYFPELGYTGLYEATVVADWEDDRDRFRSGALVRDLASNDMQTRRDVIARRDEIRGRFHDDRWAAFKRDLELFREANPVAWHASLILKDHGYNGTPATTLLLGTLAERTPLDTPTFVRVASLMDVALLLGMAVVVSASLGAELGLGVLALWLANPLSGSEFVAGSYLRLAWLVLLALALVSFARDRPALSGLFFALSALLRLFPIAFVAGLVLHDVLRAGGLAKLRARSRLYASFAVTSVLFVAATSLVRAPDGSVAWRSFAERITTHASDASPNRIGLRYPFLYAEHHDMAAVRRAAEHGVAIDWVAATADTFAQRRVWYLLAAAAWVGLAVASARRGEPGALLAGMLLPFGLLFLSHYYYSMLALIPLVFARGGRLLVLLAAGFALFLVTGWLTPVQDREFLFLSLEVGALLLGVVALTWRQGSRSTGAAAVYSSPQ